MGVTYAIPWPLPKASGAVISESMPMTRPVTLSTTGPPLNPVVRSLAPVSCRWTPLPSVAGSRSLATPYP